MIEVEETETAGANVESKLTDHARVAVGAKSPATSIPVNPNKDLPEIERRQTGENPATGEFKTKAGVVLRCRQTPTPAFMKLRKQIRKPEPPVQITTIGPQVNDAHPDYKKAMVLYNEQVEEKARSALIELGVVSSSIEIDHAVVAEMREGMAALGQDISDISNKEVYITYVLIPEEDELYELYKFLQNLGKPTYEEVVINREAFRGDIQAEG